MCHKCNEALLASAEAANLLASAAKTLYEINRTNESQILAEAAAELFKPVEEVASETASESVSGKAGSDETVRNPYAKFNESLPSFLHVAGDGTLYVDNVPVGKVGTSLHVRTATKH